MKTDWKRKKTTTVRLRVKAIYGLMFRFTFVVIGYILIIGRCIVIGYILLIGDGVVRSLIGLRDSCRRVFAEAICLVHPGACLYQYED